MQAAVDIVNTSPHPANKIAATIAGKDQQGQDFALSFTNKWPEPIRHKIGTDTRIGNSSGTIHAETVCLLSAPITQGAAMFVTDPPCPNCVKYMAEAGIKTLYIDHKGFDKDFAQRRGDDFTHMSMRICEHAGISVYELWRKEEKIVPILEVPEYYIPPEENPVRIEDENTAPAPIESDIYAHAIATDKGGKRRRIMAALHPIIGYTFDTVERTSDKYSFYVQPVTRVLMNAKRHGLTIEPDSLYSSTVPTARQLVNMVGAGLTTITIGDMTKSRDEFGPMALKQLINAGILNVNH